MIQILVWLLSIGDYNVLNFDENLLKTEEVVDENPLKNKGVVMTSICFPSDGELLLKERICTHKDDS